MGDKKGRGENTLLERPTLVAENAEAHLTAKEVDKKEET